MSQQSGKCLNAVKPLSSEQFILIQKIKKQIQRSKRYFEGQKNPPAGQTGVMWVMPG